MSIGTFFNFKANEKSLARERFEKAARDSAQGKPVDLKRVAEDAEQIGITDPSEFDKLVSISRQRMAAREEIATLPALIASYASEADEAKAEVDRLHVRINELGAKARDAEKNRETAARRMGELRGVLNDTAPAPLREKYAEVAARGSLTRLIQRNGYLDRCKRIDLRKLPYVEADDIRAHIALVEKEIVALRAKADEEGKLLAELEAQILAA